MIQTVASRTDGAYFRAYTVGDIPGVLDKIEDRFTEAADKPIAPVPSVSQVAEPVKATRPENQPVKMDPRQTAGAESEKGTMFLLPLVLAVSLVILGAVVLLMTLKRKSTDGLAETDDATERDFSPPPGTDQLHGELIDVENVMKTGSLSLALDAVSVSIGRIPVTTLSFPLMRYQVPRDNRISKRVLLS